MLFTKLDDSPMFRKQVQTLEESSESLRERCLKFYKGCRKYTEGLGEGYDGDIAFASSLESFGGGHNDPISVAFGGPVMTKFTIALREIGTYKEVLRSQVEHMLNDRLMQFVDVDLLDVKDARKRFDKASLLYDQAREKYLSLRKGTKADVATAIEDELHSARSSFEQARFNLVTALSNIESKKRFEFLEAVSGTMDAHLRYFKQGYELLHQMEPYIHQVLAYAQQSRERSNYEQAALIERMQEFKRQIDRESRWSPNGAQDFPNGDGIQAIGRSSHKMIEAVMQTASKGKVETIRQGYLSKRSSNLRGDWKRRFFVLDSRGMLYYYRKQHSRPSGSHLSNQRLHNSGDHGAGLLSRWFSSHYHGGVHDEKAVARHTVNLLTSTIKVDADQSDLRFCFRIISPTKNYTLQAENAMDQMDWIEKITGVIASLLSSQSPEQRLLMSPTGSRHQRTTSESSSFDSSTDFDHSVIVEDPTLDKTHYYGGYSGHLEHSVRGPQHHHRYRGSSLKHEKPIDLLRKVSGNNMCADCDAPEPDWASLNLGVLLCIECSGVHRNLGVHISKVRSLTLDVRVWEPSVINLFQSLGNSFANSIWEEMLASSCNYGDCDDPSSGSNNKATAHHVTVTKPKHSDPISVKEKFIHAKYTDKDFMRREIDLDPQRQLAASRQLWHCVHANDNKSAYRLIITSSADINAVYTQHNPPAPFPSLSSPDPSLTLAKAIYMQERQLSLVSISDQTGGSSTCQATSSSSISDTGGRNHPATSSEKKESERGREVREKEERESYNYEGFSLLHLACRNADLGMVELLLQYGASVNAVDGGGRTPLHHCILKGRHLFAKLLLSRGADPHSIDIDGKTPLQYALDTGTIDDEEILLLLEDPIR